MDAIQFSNASIGRKLKAGRVRVGLTQAQVAKKARIYPETLSRLENGLGNPTIKLIRQITKAIDPSKYNADLLLEKEEKVKERTIEVKLRNSWLDSLEDLLYCHLTPRERRVATENSKRIWGELVSKWDWSVDQASQQRARQRPRALARS